MGPGFIVGVNCWVAIETNRGPDLGKIFHEGSPEPDTGRPAKVMGYGLERVIYAHREGHFKTLVEIGKPIDAETVFREDAFSELTGLPIGERIRMDHILSMLNHHERGMKGIPLTSHAAVVFNQADADTLTPGDWDLIRKALRKSYSAAILTSLRTDLENCEVILDRR